VAKDLAAYFLMVCFPKAIPQGPFEAQSELKPILSADFNVGAEAPTQKTKRKAFFRD